jgi:hypothetical protein
MNAQEAISLAWAVIQDEPFAGELNPDGANAHFIDGAKALAESRAKWPESNFDFKYDDSWMVAFPFWKPDQALREWFLVRVDPATGEARISET